MPPWQIRLRVSDIDRWQLHNNAPDFTFFGDLRAIFSAAQDALESKEAMLDVTLFYPQPHSTKIQSKFCLSADSIWPDFFARKLAVRANMKSTNIKGRLCNITFEVMIKDVPIGLKFVWLNL